MTNSEVKIQIENLGFRVNPISHNNSNLVHGDGLVQTHREDIYTDDVKQIVKNIWNGNFSMKEKLDLNEFLASKLKV